MFEVSRFGGATTTQINLISLILLGLAAIGIFTLPRRRVAIPFLMVAVLIPLAQNVVILGLNLQAIRLVIFMGVMRMAFSGELRTLFRPLHRLDRVVVLWAVVSSVTFCLLYRDTAAVVQRLGMLYTTFGLYFTLRFLIRDISDVRSAFATLALVCAICAAAMVTEHFTAYNIFRLVGASETPDIRNGSIRAIGPFAHPLTAGVFGGAMAAPFLGLAITRGHRLIGAVGLVSALAMAFSTASSTPLMAALSGVLAACAWPVRHHMRTVRWAVAAVLIGLHFVMRAPVWALIGRLDLTGGSSSYHRYALVNAAIERFQEWWLVGTASTAHWGWFLGDTSNQYVEQAVTGGIAALGLYIAIIVVGFSIVGQARANAVGRDQEFLAWALGSGLFAHSVAFIGVTYWDATLVGWYGLLAAIQAATGKDTTELPRASRNSKRRSQPSRFLKKRPHSPSPLLYNPAVSS